MKIVGLSAAYELSAVTGPALIVWVLWFAAAELEVFALLTLARLIITYAILCRSFRDLRRWRPLEQVSERELLALDRRLLVAPRRFAASFTALLVLALVLMTALRQLTVPDTQLLPLGHLRMLGLILLGLCLGVSPMLTSLLDPPLLEVRSELGARLNERDLEAQRQQGSMVGWSARLNIPYILSIFFCIVGIVGKLAVDGWREAGLGAQYQRTSEAARMIDGGELDQLALDDRGYALADTRAQLPPAIARVSAPDERGPLVAHDFEADTILAAAPLADGRWVWSEVPNQDYSRLVWLLALGFPFAFIAPLLVANIAITRGQTRQLTEVREATRQVLAGGGLVDIARFRPPRNDELGLLINEFNGMLDVLTELSTAAHSVARGDLTVTLGRPGDFHDAFRGMLARLHEVVGQIRETAVELRLAATDIGVNVHDQEQAVEQQSRTVSQVSEAVEELAVAATAITTATEAVLANAEQTEDTATRMVEEITRLGDSVAKIGALLEDVEGIAERSDLLALNGSLEATRAGEAGRGFALVAAEMRRLAERVARTVSQVRERVGEVSSVGMGANSSTEQTRELSRRTADAARDISTTMRSQGEETQRISTAIHEVSASVSQTASATAFTAKSTQLLALRAATLEQLTREFRLPASEGTADERHTSEEQPARALRATNDRDARLAAKQG